jgi:hypothetical protein
MPIGQMLDHEQPPNYAMAWALGRTCSARTYMYHVFPRLLLASDLDVPRLITFTVLSLTVFLGPSNPRGSSDT